MTLKSDVRVVRFWTNFKPDGKGGFKGIDMVEYCAVGKANMATTVATVSSLGKLQPIELAQDNPAIAMAHARWNGIKAAYDGWKNGNEIPLDGTPLAAWPGISSDQAGHLRTIGLRTVEEIAEASDSIITKLPFPGARELRVSAQNFLKAADKTKTASEISELQSKLSEKDDQLEELRQIVLDMQAQMSKPAVDAAEKPSRGGKSRRAETSEEAAA